RHRRRSCMGSPEAGAPPMPRSAALVPRLTSSVLDTAPRLLRPVTVRGLQRSTSSEPLEIPFMTISMRHVVFLGAALVGSLAAATRPTLAAKKSVAAPLVAASPPATGQVYTIDDAHSFVEFSVRLIGFNRVRGSFPQYEAHIYYDSAAVERSSVSVRVSVEGVDTHEPERDHHLESPAFFDAKTSPFIRFESRSIRPANGGLIADGDLTIRDVTKP